MAPITLTSTALDSETSPGAREESYRLALLWVFPEVRCHLLEPGKGPWRLGRGDECEVLVADHRASREHAEIAFKGSVIRLRDLGSTNGTFVDGAAIEGSTRPSLAQRGRGERGTDSGHEVLVGPAPRASETRLRPSEDIAIHRYPRGRWRLVDMDDLAHVVLWVSHILVRHEDVPARQLSFERTQWTAAPEPPSRSRRAAFELAQDLEQQLRAGRAFDQIASAVSEDVATRDRHGSLGGIMAIQLRPWPQVLDALAATREGEISRIVETEFGFHLFLRRPPVVERRVSGARIIIGHADTSWFGPFPADRRTVRRTRSEALELAHSMFEKARAYPEDFARLVREFSEHRDFVRDGDLGEWSTREPTPFPSALEALQGLDIGEIAPPMDSLFGFQIIQRTPIRPRREYAMRYVILPYGDDLPDADEGSSLSVRRRGEAVLRDVLDNPARLETYQQRYCCKAPQQWVEGRGSSLVERALAERKPGDVVPHLIERDRSYLVAQRVAPAGAATIQTAFELPSPTRPDVRYLISRLHGLSQLPAVYAKAAPMLGLENTTATRLAWLHDADRLENASASASGWSTYQELQQQTRELLGPELYERYSGVLYRHFEDYLLGPRQPDSTLR